VLRILLTAASASSELRSRPSPNFSMYRCIFPYLLLNSLFIDF
jgi:hypothetical protein